MSKNPFVNSFVALGYIILVVLIMNFGMKRIGPSSSFAVPVLILSLFTLSAAVMGYLFGYQPINLYLEGKKKEAVDLFLKTVGVFAAITAVILVLVFGRFVS